MPGARTAASAALLALGLVLTSCASGTPATEQTLSISASAPPPLQTSTPLPTGSAGEVPPARWDAVVRDLADRGVSDPELVSAEEVVFNDASLGCPTPGVSYTQAQVDGMRVIVTAEGHRYDYRFGSDDEPVLCTR